MPDKEVLISVAAAGKTVDLYERLAKGAGLADIR